MFILLLYVLERQDGFERLQIECGQSGLLHVLETAKAARVQDRFERPQIFCYILNCYLLICMTFITYIIVFYYYYFIIIVYCFYWFYVKHIELQFLYEMCYINKVLLLLLLFIAYNDKMHTMIVGWIRV